MKYTLNSSIILLSVLFLASCNGVTQDNTVIQETGNIKSEADTSKNETLDTARDSVRMNMKSETPEELKSRLTSLQYMVTQGAETEEPFSNIYDKNYEEGIYVDIIDGTPLFSSTTKFDSGTGWPSFSSPISSEFIEEREDNILFYKRTEIIGAKSDSHIGHLFDDGPKEAGGMRYCLNSASLAFIPKAEMEERGYGEYLSLF